MAKVVVIIPAFNEEESIGSVLNDIPKELVDEVIVCNNASTDLTGSNASNAGATVLMEPRRGYGFACLKGLDYIAKKPLNEQPDIVVFMDGDYSDYPSEINLLIDPIKEGHYDMIIGSRALGTRERGSMTIPQIIGNKIASILLLLLYRVKTSDLGPFRAIQYQKLVGLDMQDTTFGWTVEMQVKAAKKKYRVKEVAVNYRKRIGFSKISGTVKGSILAAYKIIWTIFKHV